MPSVGSQGLTSTRPSRSPSGRRSGFIAQLVGASVGSLLFAATAGMDAVTIGGLGATAPFPGIGMGAAILAELLGPG